MASLGGLLGGIGSGIGTGAKFGYKFGGRALRAVPAIGAIVREISPRIEDEIQVAAYMMPGGRRKDAYYLAASLAFALLKNRTVLGLFPPNGYVMCEYSLTENVVIFRARFMISGIEAVINNGLDANAVQQSLTQDLVVFNGPQDNFTGGKWAFTSKVIGALVGVPTPATAPALPLDGKTILTTDTTYSTNVGTFPSLNPVPPGDAVSATQVVGTSGGAPVLNLVMEIAQAILSPPNATLGMQRNAVINPPPPPGVFSPESA